MATTQVIVGGGKGIIAAGTYYYMPFGDFSGQSAANERRVTLCASPSGTVKSFRVRLSVAPGVGNSYTFTFRKNASDQLLSVQISGNNTTGSDLVNTFTVAAGDRVCLKVASGGSPPDSVPSFSWEFVPDTDNNFWLGGCLVCQAAGTRYSSLYGGVQLDDTESRVQAPMPVGGTFKNLYVDLSTSPGTAPDAYTFVTRMNGADGNLTVTITAPDTTGSDLTNTDTVAVYDDVDLSGVPVETPANALYASFGLTFIPGESGKAPVLTGSGGLTVGHGSDLGPYYNTLANRLYEAWSATDDNRFVLTSARRMRNFYCKLDGPPGTDKSFTLTLRRNTADTTLTVAISGADTQGSDTTHYEDALAGDLLSISWIANAATYTPRAVRFGFTLEIVAGPAGIAAVNEVAAVNINEVNKVAWAGIAKVDEVG